MKPLDLRVHEKHPDTDAYRFGPSYTPYAIVAVDKRLTDSELAAIYWGYVQTDMLWPDARLDVDETDSDYWEAACERWREAEKTVLRFATLPHYDEDDQ